MTCEILTEGMLEAALRRDLSADQRAALLRHLREPCEACLDLLEEKTAEEMLPDGALSPREQQRLFEAGRPLLRLARSEGRRAPRLAWGAIAAAVALAGVVTMVPARQRLKG